MPQLGDSDVHTRASFIIPHGLALLRTCKSLTHQLLACVIDGASTASTDSSRSLVTGSIDAIIEASKSISPQVDDLTKVLYPPIDAELMLTAATALVSAIEHLVMVTRRNCNPERLRWLDGLTDAVVRNFEALRDSVEFYQAAESTENDADA